MCIEKPAVITVDMCMCRSGCVSWFVNYDGVSVAVFVCVCVCGCVCVCVCVWLCLAVGDTQ